MNKIKLFFIEHIAEPKIDKLFTDELLSQGRPLDKNGKPKRAMSDCHLYWHIKKEYLKEHYGIDWKSPAELNLGTLYD